MLYNLNINQTNFDLRINYDFQFDNFTLDLVWEEDTEKKKRMSVWFFRNWKFAQWEMCKTSAPNFRIVRYLKYDWEIIL